MSRLLRVELRRLWARRLTWWALVGVLAVAGLTAFSAYGTAKPPSDAEVAQAEQMYQQELEWWEEEGEDQVAACRAEEEAAAEPDVDYGCDDMEPRREWFLPPEPRFVPDVVDVTDEEAAARFAGETGTTAGDPQVVAINASLWNDWEAGTQRIAASSLMVVAIAFVLGVSFVTAETSSGALGLWLTFEPRRRRVFWSKAAAAGLGTAPLSVIGVAALVGGVYAVYTGFGTLGDLTVARWGEIAAFGGRLVVAATAFAMIGAALGAVLRHAAAAIGVAAVLGWVGVVVAGAVDSERWSPMTNLLAWIEGGAVYGSQNCSPDESGVVVCEWVEHAVPQTQGGLYLLVLTAVLLLVAAVVFRRRDVG